MKRSNQDNLVKKLYRENRELTLLEYLYVAITVVTVLIAGIIALFNQAIGVAILVVPMVSVIAFLMNIVALAVLKYVIESIYPDVKNREEKSEKKPKKK